MLIIIQARLSSKRLQGKVLKEIAGKPMLKWIIQRLKNIKNPHQIIIATSVHRTDDNIFDFAQEERIPCFRGSLENVIDRFINSCERYKSDHFVRICGDSPLIDPNLIDYAISISKNLEFDVITNVQPRSYPKGQSVELIKLKSLQKLYMENLNSEEKEHVTKGFYQRKEDYKIINFKSSKKSFSNIQLSVDTEEDFKKIEALINCSLNENGDLKYGWEQFALLYLEKYGQR